MPGAEEPAAARIYVAADPLGNELRAAVVAHLQQAHPELLVEDLGTQDKYYEAAHKVGGLVQNSRAAGGQDRAVLCCGTGMGMSIIANKFPSVYAAVVESPGAAGNAAAINNANVLALGGMVFKAEEAAAAVDKWLGTAFTSGYDEYKGLLEASMKEIPELVKSSANGGGISSSSIPYPSAALLVDGQLAGNWQPIEAMGHSSCLWCKLREDVAAASSSSSSSGPGTRVRGLARFPKGCKEPPHHHSHGHDVLVLSGKQTVHNLTSNKSVTLGPWGYLYTPAAQVHSVDYQEDTVFFIGFDGAMDILWEDPQKAAGVTFESEEARVAAEAPWQPSEAVAAAVRGAVEGSSGR